jgi:hypothetical protein
MTPELPGIPLRFELIEVDLTVPILPTRLSLCTSRRRSPRSNRWRI